MRLTFKTDGGAAHFPGLARPIQIQTEELPGAEAVEIEQKVHAAGLFERPERDPSPTVPDGRSYLIAVEDDGRSCSVSVHDPVADPDVASLIKTLTRYQRRTLAARRA